MAATFSQIQPRRSHASGELRRALGGKVVIDVRTRTSRSHDCPHLSAGTPVAVVRPTSTADVATAVRICGSKAQP